MYLQLHRLCIHLRSDDDGINRQWRWLFDGWIEPVGEDRPADIRLSLRLAATLPPLPAGLPFFSDAGSSTEPGILSVYRGEAGRVWLHFIDGALVEAPLQAAGEAIPWATGDMTPQALANGRLEDVTFTSMAPLLRRQGFYLLHAFAASKDGQTALFVGPSGSGKTTAGLSLLLAGWRLLANDVVLLEERPDGIYALPTPGAVNIRPGTFDLLPGLHSFLDSPVAPASAQALPGQRLAHGQYASPAPVTAIYFPQIETRPDSALTQLNSALCLARLLSESMDHWDEPMMAAHLDCLQKLSRQAAASRLRLGRNVADLPRRLAAGEQ